MAKPKPAAPIERVEIYDRLIDAHPAIERKGAANHYTSVNGHMFSCMNKLCEIALRLSTEERAVCMEKYPAELLLSYNTVMKEYVVVPNEVLFDVDTFMMYLNMSFDYVSSLRPKPTTRKAKNQTASNSSGYMEALPDAASGKASNASGIRFPRLHSQVPNDICHHLHFCSIRSRSRLIVKFPGQHG